MFSLATIRHMSAQAARKARAAKNKPHIVNEFQLESWKNALEGGSLPRLPFPNLGDYRPKGWTLIDTMLCDASGLGSPSEPALTARQLIGHRLKVGMAYGIVEQGQFQIVLAEFRPPVRMLERGILQ